MAVDSAAKRLSMLGFGDVHAFGVTPTATIDAAARASFLDLYQGVPLNSPATTGPAIYCDQMALMSDADVAVQAALSAANIDVQAGIEDTLEAMALMSDGDVVVIATISDDDVDVLATIEC